MNSSAIGECVVKQCAMKYTAEVTPLMKVDWVMAELSAQHFGIGSVSEFAEEELARPEARAFTRGARPPTLTRGTFSLSLQRASLRFAFLPFSIALPAPLSICAGRHPCMRDVYDGCLLSLPARARTQEKHHHHHDHHVIIIITMSTLPSQAGSSQLLRGEMYAPVNS